MIQKGIKLPWNYHKKNICLCSFAGAFDFGVAESGIFMRESMCTVPFRLS